MDRCVAGGPGRRAYCAEKLKLYRKTRASKFSPTACPKGRGRQPELSPMLSGFAAHCDPSFWRGLACKSTALPGVTHAKTNRENRISHFCQYPCGNPACDHGAR